MGDFNPDTYVQPPGDTDADGYGPADALDQRDRYECIVPGGRLTGRHVRNPAGEELGTIEELMIDCASGRVAYAVLSFGGFLGLGSKLFAVPFDALTLQDPDRDVLLHVDRKRLKDAPGFDQDHWPNMADPVWGSEIHRFYGQRDEGKP